jgi:acetyl esterase
MCARCDLQTDRSKASVAPGLAHILADLAARGLGTPDPAGVTITEARTGNEAYFKAIAEPRAAVHSVSLATVLSSDGFPVPVKVVVPLGAKDNAPAMLYCHGGGYAFGDINTHDHVIRALAAATGMVVFGVDYRRTPEVAFPVPLQDALAALSAMRGAEWVQQFHHNPAKIVITGDSAGAHLCLALMLALREHGLPQVQGAALIYGMYARRYDSWSHHAYGDGRFGLSSAKMRWFWDQLLPERPVEDAQFAEAMDAHLAGLPPLALFAAECDCLLDDTLDFRENCKGQDHPHTFDLFRGATHGFMHLCSVYSGTRDAMTLVAERLAKIVG